MLPTMELTDIRLLYSHLEEFFCNAKPGGRNILSLIIHLGSEEGINNLELQQTKERLSQVYLQNLDPFSAKC